MKTLNDGYVVSQDFEASKATIGARMQFTCAACAASSKAKTVKVADNGAGVFALCVCPECKARNIFQDKKGNYVSWGRRQSASSE